MAGARVLAVIFDLDGTLLDTERATRGVLEEFLAIYGKVPDAEKEERRLGQMHMESAASIVRDYELPMTAGEYSEMIMPMYQKKWSQSKALPGVDRVIKHLRKHGIPLALASNSMRKHIELKISHKQGWKESFSVILGGDEVRHGKPSPDIFLEAAKRLGLDTSNCLVIEDSPVGVRAAKASGAKVIAVPSLQSRPEFYSIADCILHSLLEFQPELWGLPAFEDWIQHALPIEPVCIGGLINEGASHDGCTVLNVAADDTAFASLPDQVSGVFFGWAKMKVNGIYKVVVSIGWDLSSSTPMRVIQPQLLGPVTSCTLKEQLYMLFIGYIRRPRNEAITRCGLELSEEDKSIAMSLLDLPIFSQYQNSPLIAEPVFEKEMCC